MHSKRSDLISKPVAIGRSNCLIRRIAFPLRSFAVAKRRKHQKPRHLDP
jgi:hypothetical protein